MIEGTSIKSKKCSGKGPELDATKTAKKEKKERQREKKVLNPMSIGSMEFSI